MTTYVALLRAVNVGGTGKLAMADLKSLCVKAGFDKVQTYIASGNIVFESKEPAAGVRSVLESRLHAHAKKPIDVFLRTSAEMRAILAANPFTQPEPKFVYAFFSMTNHPPTPRPPRNIEPGKRFTWAKGNCMYSTHREWASRSWSFRRQRAGQPET